jgi:hypothetical protein
MEADASNHPDEGMIHAWLDDALEPAEAARIAEHLRGCAECSARVAEARGLIAGASRIIGALDDVPAGARPAWSQAGVVSGDASTAPAGPAARPGDNSLWRRLRVTPARSAIAATLIVALGITLTRQRTAVESPELARTASAPVMAPIAARADSPASAGATEGNAVPQSREAARAQDHLLDSAVAKSLAISHPQRALEAVPGTAIPQMPAGAAAATTAPDTLAGLQVAAGRRAVQSERVAIAGEREDKARVGGYAAATPPPAAEVLDAAKSADMTLRAKVTTAPSVASSSTVGGARSCYVVESPTAGGNWGGEALPLLVVVDSAARTGAGTAPVFTVAGVRTPLQARWIRVGRDSLSLSLRRIGYSGTISLGAELAGGRAGVARSGPQTTLLEEVVAGAAQPRNQAEARDTQARVASSARGLAKDERGAAGAAREYPVTMRSAACPRQ